MPFPTLATWKSDTSRWWSSRSVALRAVDTALDNFNQSKTNENFQAIANAMEAWMESKDDWTKSTRNTGRNGGVVAALVDEIAGSEYWRGVRTNTSGSATRDFFLRYATAASNSYNREFLEDPAGFLGRYSVYCYNVEGVENLDSYGLENTSLGGRDALSFEFVREEKSGTHVSLKIAPNGRGGEDEIKAGWIPYRGQSASPDPDLFGHLAVLASTYRFIFTVGLGGCRIAVVDLSGILHMYHEPTQDSWKTPAKYPGRLLGHYSPDYATAFSGFTCFEKKAGIWWAHVQTHGLGGSVASLESTRVGD